MEPVQIEFTMDPEAYTRLMRRLASKRHFWPLGIGMAVFLVINRQIFKGPIYIWVLPLIIFGGLFYYFFNLIIRRTYRAASQLHHPLRYTFSEDQVTVESEQNSHSYEWDNFERVLELPDWFVLYQNKIVFNPVPQQAFGSEEKLEQVRNLLIGKGLLS